MRIIINKLLILCTILIFYPTPAVFANSIFFTESRYIFDKITIENDFILDDWDASVEASNTTYSPSLVTPGTILTITTGIRNNGLNSYASFLLMVEMRNSSGAIIGNSETTISNLTAGISTLSTTQITVPSYSTPGTYSITCTIFPFPDNLVSNNTFTNYFFIGDNLGNQQFRNTIGQETLQSSAPNNTISVSGKTFTLLGINTATQYSTMRDPSGSSDKVYVNQVKIYGTYDVLLRNDAVWVDGTYGYSALKGFFAFSPGPTYDNVEIHANPGTTVYAYADAPSGYLFSSGNYELYSSSTTTIKSWLSIVSKVVSWDRIKIKFDIPVNAPIGKTTLYLLTEYSSPAGYSDLTRLIFNITNPPPSLISLSYTTFKPGDILTITGANLGTSGVVKFNDIQALSITSWSSGSITCIVPNGITNGVLRVINSDGTSNGLSYLASYPPTISSFTPAGGAIGSTVTISGINFDPVPANNIVRFGAVKATVSTANSTSLTVVVPTGSTYQPFTVTVNGLTAFASKPFNVTFISSQIIDAATFAPKVDFTSGTSPEAIAISDIDGDGKTDIIVTNVNGGSISVYRNISASGTITTGSFSPKVDFSSSSGARGIAIGDINGDGKPDIVITNYGSNTISVFQNISSSGSITTGSFSTKVDFATGINPYGVSVGDLDGDGKADLAVTNNGDNTVSVFRNTFTSGLITTSSFASKVDLITGLAPIGVTIGDLDGDGKPELTVANQSSNSISVFRNISTSGSITTGSFSTRVDFITGTNPYEVVIGDIDGDGKPDLAISNTGSSSVSIFRNTSLSGSITIGSFANKVDLTTGSNPRGVSFSDIDGDGKPDLSVANQWSWNISIFKNISISGNITLGSFSAKVDLNTGENPYGVAIGDFDGDGKPDLALANNTPNSISVFQNTIAASATQTAPTIGTITHPTCTVATGSVVLNGLPSTGTWTLTRSPGNIIITGSGTSTTITGLAAGTYTYTVTNSSAVTSAPSGDVVINSQPVTPIAPTIGIITQPSCSVPTGWVELKDLPSSAWTVTITPGGATITGAGSFYVLTGISPGTYSYTVTNPSGCISSSSIDVIINSQPLTPSAPVVGAITHPTCAVATGTVVLNGLPASGTWTVTQSPGGTLTTGTGTSTTISSLGAGTYRFTITNASSCTSAQSADVVINPQANTPVAPKVGIITHPTCSVSSGAVELSDLPATGTWTLTRSPDGTTTTGSGTSITISSIAPGSYTYTVTNASSCVSVQSAAVVINAQPVTPTAPTVGTVTPPTCYVATGSIQLTGLPSTGNWTITSSPGGAILPGSGTTVTISGIAPGTYTYTVTNAAGCASVASAGATINVQPATPTAPVVGTITHPTCIAATGSVILSGLPAGTWTLTRSPGGTTTGTTTTTTISNLAAGYYTFTVTNSSSCTSAASSNIIINPQPGTPPAPTVGTITQPTCALSTGSVILSGIPTTGSWVITRSPGGTITSGNGTTTTISGLTPGTYSFTLSIGTSCTAASGNVIISSVPIGIIPVIIRKWNDVLICTNLNNKIDKYQWYKGTTPLTGETQDQFYWAKNQSGAYQVLTTDKDGCKNYSNIIQIGSGSKSLTAFPNPVRENVTIDLNDEPTGKAVISVFSEIGVKVLEFETEKEFENLIHELSVETLDEGIYFIRVTIDKVNVYSTKIVVAK